MRVRKENKQDNGSEIKGIYIEKSTIVFLNGGANKNSNCCFSLSKGTYCILIKT